MPEFVLDASVAISWCFPGDPTEDTAYSRHILAELAVRDAIVPEVWPFEIANVIFVSFNKRKRITETQITEYMSSYVPFRSALSRTICGPISDWNLGRGSGTWRLMTPPIWIWRHAETFPWQRQMIA